MTAAVIPFPAPARPGQAPAVRLLPRPAEPGDRVMVLGEGAIGLMLSLDVAGPIPRAAVRLRGATRIIHPIRLAPVAGVRLFDDWPPPGGGAAA